MNSVGGTFFGVPELVPLVGGSGGGGGGALLIAANGTVTITNYQLFADGGNGGSVGNGGCARGGSGGAGGAIRLLANRFAQGGAASLFARGGGISFSGGNGTPGRIRLESLDPSAQAAFTAEPAAIRITGPGPLSNPISPRVAITAVGGNTVPAEPQGHLGAIDLTLSAPGVTGVDVSTTGVPSGTTVEVKVKPRIGGDAVASTVPLTNCDALGACTASTTFNLSAGAYVVEARATFQVP